MSVLLDAAAIHQRRLAVSGPLGALADSLAGDLGAAIARDLVIPPEKARLTRRGGRCETDGALLEFDPFSPRVHRCLTCGATYDDDSHYRWWIMNYQLWLAERAVHAALLFAIRGDVRHRDLARFILDAYAERYLAYPNRDNVLGPTRVFFSTYLESIWVLQLIVAMDLLELASPASWHRPLGERVRERIVEPSTDLIRGYDEGLSNRQTWNNAALLAGDRLLRRKLDERTLHGSSGLSAHLTKGLLADGTWYEGENYHLFAHRALWYGVTIASHADVDLEPSLIRRFDEAFATPFVTALPDFTFPSRRDSQYAVSLRQWRFAELAELGMVRQPGDVRLQGALRTLYDNRVPRADTGRARSTAEAERNTPATALGRADLGWRSLAFALPDLPELALSAPQSALLPSQGLAILRRDNGALFAALDYGHSGAGHGHPDRLNFVLVHGARRWLDDVGTGSYVDPSLHWYRSTLAHNAPLVNGRSQRRADGRLIAFEERGGAGWVRASFAHAGAQVSLERTLVAMPSYVVDTLTWRSASDVQIDLPIHADGELTGVGSWRSAVPEGGAGLEDGFSFLRDTETSAPQGDVRLAATLGDSSAIARVHVDAPHDWWRAVSYGAPGSGPARFHFVRARGREGSITAVWDLTKAVSHVSHGDKGVTVTLGDGTRHQHRTDATGWHVSLSAGAATSSIDLGGLVPTSAPQEAEAVGRAPTTIGTGPLSFTLGERQYRRSEPTWAEAGRPAATVTLAVEGPALTVTVDVAKRDVHFAPPRDTNPLDNEHPDTNSDGVQVHLNLLATAFDDTGADVTWLLVPEGDGRVRVTTRTARGTAPPLAASSHRTPTGYTLRAAIPVSAFQPAPSGPRRLFLLGVIVNDMSPERERRRGQLVLGGTAGEFVYLRGDRLPLEEQLPFILADV